MYQDTRLYYKVTFTCLSCGNKETNKIERVLESSKQHGNTEEEYEIHYCEKCLSKILEKYKKENKL